jgi:hypothetical protein
LYFFLYAVCGAENNRFDGVFWLQLFLLHLPSKVQQNFRRTSDFAGEMPSTAKLQNVDAMKIDIFNIVLSIRLTFCTALNDKAS